MVVLLAIAGAVAVVLFNRAQTETDRLESSEDTFAWSIPGALQCRSLGHEWKAVPAANGPVPTADQPGLTAAGMTFAAANSDVDKNDGYCKPVPRS